MKRCVLYLFICLALAGCAGDQHSQQSVSQGAPPIPPAAEIVALPEISRDDLNTALASVKVESQNSNNAVQQSLTGLGLNLGKVAEKVEADLVRMNNDLRVQITNTATASADLRAELHAQANVNAQAFAELRASINAQAQATAQGQLGLMNRIESTQQTTSAGRDAVSNTQFSDQMAATLKDDNRTICYIVWIMSGLIVGQSELSRRRADRRHRESEARHVAAFGKPTNGEMKCDPKAETRRLPPVS